MLCFLLTVIVIYLAFYVFQNKKILYKIHSQSLVTSIPGIICGVYGRQSNHFFGMSQYFFYKIVKNDGEEKILHGRIRYFCSESEVPVGRKVVILCDDKENPICCQEEKRDIERETKNKILMIVIILMIIIGLLIY